MMDFESLSNYVENRRDSVEFSNLVRDSYKFNIIIGNTVVYQAERAIYTKFQVNSL